MPQPMFEKIDANKDGKITLAEMKAAKEKFGKGRHGKGGERHFAKLDANGDGKLTQAEAAAASNRHFDRIDANKDGAVTLEEMKTARKSWGKGHGGKGHGKRGGRSKTSKTTPA